MAYDSLPGSSSPDGTHSDVPLARRLERVEGSCCADFVQARARVLPEAPGDWIDLHGVLAMFDGPESHSTQSFGIGLSGPVSSDSIDRLENFFHQRKAAALHEVSLLADASLFADLAARGYRPVETCSVLIRRLHPASAPLPPGNRAISVREIAAGEEEENLWVRTAARGWADVAPGIDEYLLGLKGVRRYQRHSHGFLAEHAGETIAAAALSLSDGVALLSGASTIPEFRRQGAQLALLAHRLRFAAKRGCDWAMVVSPPGSSSQRNAERHGFRLAYHRMKWCLPPPASGADTVPP